MSDTKQNKLPIDIHFEFDGIGGFCYSYGAGSHGYDVVTTGDGDSYMEAFETAMDMLADSGDDIDVGFYSEATALFEKALERAAREEGIDLHSTEEVEEFRGEMCGDEWEHEWRLLLVLRFNVMEKGEDE